MATRNQIIEKLNNHLTTLGARIEKLNHTELSLKQQKKNKPAEFKPKQQLHLKRTLDLQLINHQKTAALRTAIHTLKQTNGYSAEDIQSSLEASNGLCQSHTSRLFRCGRSKTHTLLLQALDSQRQAELETSASTAASPTTTG